LDEPGWIAVVDWPMEMIVETPASQIGVPASPAPAGELSLQPRSAVAWGSLLLLVTVVVFWALLRSQFEFAIRFPSDWGHTLIVPLLSGWLVMRDRATLEAMQPFKPSWVGLLAAVAGLSFYLVSLVGPSWFTVHHNARQLGFGLYLFGTALLLFGWRPMRVLFFPLAYLVIFGFTYTDRIIGYFTQQLQDISAYGGYVMLVVIGLDVEIQGNTIYVGEGALNIAEACSGMRMLVAFMALGTLMAYIGLKAWWQRALLIALGVPVAVFVNMLRVATLGILSLWDTGLAGGQFHAFVGFVWLVPAFLVFLGLMAIVQRLVVEVETPKGKAA
jgi:exosortase